MMLLFFSTVVILSFVILMYNLFSNTFYYETWYFIMVSTQYVVSYSEFNILGLAFINLDIWVML